MNNTKESVIAFFKSIENTPELTRIVRNTYYNDSPKCYTTCTSCYIDTFSWAKSPEGYTYWDTYWRKLVVKYKEPRPLIHIPKLHKLVLSLYPKSTYPEYYI